MRTISHRELRNNSAQILREVRAGEIIEVTNHGEVAAVLVPPSASTFERLVTAGKVRRPVANGVKLTELPRGVSNGSAPAIIRDLRGDR